MTITPLVTICTFGDNAVGIEGWRATGQLQLTICNIQYIYIYVIRNMQYAICSPSATVVKLQLEYVSHVIVLQLRQNKCNHRVGKSAMFIG